MPYGRRHAYVETVGAMMTKPRLQQEGLQWYVRSKSGVRVLGPFPTRLHALRYLQRLRGTLTLATTLLEDNEREEILSCPSCGTRGVIFTNQMPPAKCIECGFSGELDEFAPLFIGGGGNAQH